MRRLFYKNYLTTSFWVCDLWVFIITPILLLAKYHYFSADFELLVVITIQLLFLTSRIVFTYYKVEKIKHEVETAKSDKPSSSTIKFYYTTKIRIIESPTHLEIIRNDKVIQVIEKPISNNATLLLIKSDWFVWTRSRDINTYYQLFINDLGDFQEILKIVADDIVKIDADEVEMLANDIAALLNVQIKTVLG